MNTVNIAVVGAGWAGLATAVTLTHAGFPVKLFESARQTGGRARRIPFNDVTVDNGQHLLIGAYREIISLMQMIGVDTSETFLRQRLSLISKYQDGKTLALQAPKLPTPLHLLWTLLTAQGLTRHERLAAMRFGMKLKLGKLKTYEDISVTELLQRQGQPMSLNEALWNPLCLAILNTHPHEASAEIFIRVLADAFLYQRQDSDLLYAKTDLSQLLPDPAIDYIEKHGGHVRLAHRISDLDIHNNRVNGVWSNKQLHTSDQVVLALPPYATASLIKPHPTLASLAVDLGRFEFEPICTVYLQYPESVRLPLPMLGMLGSISQWVFDRKICGQAGLIAVVISSSGSHMKLSNSQLQEIISSELSNLFPSWPTPLGYQVIREKRATFASRVGINQMRPGNRTTVEGLWLAGDYTHTGYPATLEGAVRSGVQCAQQVIEKLK